MKKEMNCLQPNKNAIRLIARKGKSRDLFDIYVKYDRSDWVYLMSHRKNPQLFSLLDGEISLNRLYDTAHKAVTTIAQKGNRQLQRGKHMRYKQRRIHSQRVEDAVRYLTCVAYEFVQLETAHV